MFSYSNRLSGIATDSAWSVRCGPAAGDERPMVTFQMNCAYQKTRSFDDPEQLEDLIEDLQRGLKWLIEQGPRPKPRAPVGVGSGQGGVIL